LNHDEFVIERKGKALAALAPIERLVSTPDATPTTLSSTAAPKPRRIQTSAPSERCSITSRILAGQPRALPPAPWPAPAAKEQSN
jgi:hypothetical protein